MRLWSLLGPTTNRTILIVCALAGKTELFLWIVLVGGNAWLLACAALEKRFSAGAAHV